MDFLESTLLCMATGLGWLFILSYALLAPWHRYWAGRHMMLGSIVITLALTLLFFRRTGAIHDMTPAWRHTVTIAVYGSMAALMTWRMYLLARLQLSRIRRVRQHSSSREEVK